MIISNRRDQLPLLLAACATIAGMAAWVVFLRRDLIISHYDARAHLVVARRILDNLTPGWQQVGAVWLPLSHLLNMLPVQVDVLYRTGLSASLISVASFGATAYALARLVLRSTGSALGALAAVAIVTLNQNLLYIQSTPMTEPLLIALTSFYVLWMYEWIETNTDRVSARLGWVTAAAVLTRYEAWPIVGAGAVAAAYAWWRRGIATPDIAKRLRRLGIWPGVAIAAFLINSRMTVGSWFVADGFYVRDPTYLGQAGRALIALWWGTHQLSGYVVAAIAVTAAAAFGVRALRSRADATLLLALAPLGAGAVPFMAFIAGHPFRVRYMIPLVTASAFLCGLAIGRVRRLGPALATAIIASLFIESPLWRADAPLLLEAQWDQPASAGRRQVTACLKPEYRGDKVLASMGSLAHYMHELSASGFYVADFIHEGNGAIWARALEQGPAAHAGWMLVEEQAEGGDVLALRMRQNPAFTTGMTRVCEGGGVALYRRISRSATKDTKITKGVATENTMPTERGSE